MRFIIGLMLITIMMQQIQIVFMRERINDIDDRASNILSMLLDFIKKVQGENNE